MHFLTSPSYSGRLHALIFSAFTWRHCTLLLRRWAFFLGCLKLNGGLCIRNVLKVRDGMMEINKLRERREKRARSKQSLGGKMWMKNEAAMTTTPRTRSCRIFNNFWMG